MKITSRTIKRSLSIVAAIAIAAAFSAAAIGPSDAEQSSITKQRVAAMKQNGANLKKLGEAVAAGDTAAAAAAAAEVNKVASRIPALFPEGSGEGETNAKPEIWQDFADFRAKANEVESAAAKVVADAGAGNLGSDPKAVVGSIGKHCAACHKEYRKPLPQ